jgi:hypothetical protein
MYLKSMFWKLNKLGELYFFSLFTLHPVYSVRIQTKKWPFTREFSKFFTFCKYCLAKLLPVVSLCYKHITAVKFMNLVHGQMSVFTGGKATFKYVRKIQGHYKQFYRFTDECP